MTVNPRKTGGRLRPQTSPLLLEETQVLPVPLPRQILRGDESERGGVDAIPQASRGRAIREKMAQMRVGQPAAHFDAHHSKAVVHLFHDEAGINGAGEAGPACAGVEFVGRMVGFTCH